MAIPHRFDIVQDIHRKHPHLLDRNDHEAVKEFYWRAVWALHQADPRFGMVRKVGGETGQEIPGAGWVAEDAICYKDEPNIVDIIGGANNPGHRAVPGWGETHLRRPTATWVQPPPYPEPVPEQPGQEEPAQEPTPEAPAEDGAQVLKVLLVSVLQRLEGIEQQQRETRLAIAAQTTAVEAGLRELQKAVKDGVKLRF